MKFTPQQYAKALIAATNENNAKKIAADFWLKLQRNGQYKDLSKIVDAIDEEYAIVSNKVLAKIYSEAKLNETQLKEIEQKLISKLKKQVIIKEIIKKNITGVIVKINDSEFDLSVEGKIKNLKQALN